MSCPKKRKKLVNMLRELAIPAEIKKGTEKEPRVNIWDISAESIKEMVENFIIPDDVFVGSKLDGHQNIESTRIKDKIEKYLDVASEYKDTVKKFTEKLQTNLEGETEDATAMRHQAIALTEVMESVKGEIDKADNKGLELKQISPDGGILPYLPMHRVAATIGRKIMYTEGFRFIKGDDPSITPETIELSYYLAGKKALDTLKQNGFLDIVEGAPTIKDYLGENEKKLSYKEGDNIAEDVPGIALNVEAFGIADPIKAKKADPALMHFTDRANARFENHELNGYLSVLKAINLLSQPESVVLPATNPDEIQHVNDDVYNPGDTINQVREDLENSPTYIDKSLHGLFTLMYHELKNSRDSASRWLSDEIFNRDTKQNLFQVDSNNSVVSDKASFTGRNLSKTTPIDDLIEYYGSFVNRNPLYMALFAGRNARLYYDNSVLNPHSSKMMRHALTVDEYTLKPGSEVYKFYANKISLALGISGEDIQDTSSSTEDSKRLSAAIKAFNNFEKASTAHSKLNALKQMSSSFPELDFALLVTTVKAAKDIRENDGTSDLKSTYAVSSDATASGGLLTMLQALATSASNPITRFLRKMGVFKGESNLDPNIDIYSILSDRLKDFSNGEINNESLEDPSDPARMKTILELVTKELFKGKIRDLSKAPTMTSIYDQSLGGAETSLSHDLTDLVIVRLKKNKIPQGTIDLINLITGEEYSHQDLKNLNEDPNFKRELRLKFKESELPAFMYNSIQQSLTRRFLAQHKSRGKEVFNLVSKFVDHNNFRVYPASLVIDSELGGTTDTENMYSEEHLKEYGLPLEKIMEKASNINGTTVLTRKGMLRETVMNVSFVHGIDTASIYRSLKGLLTKFKTGALVIHDDIRSTPELIMAAERAYVQATYDSAVYFDIHEQVLLAAAAYNPDLKSNNKYTNLLEEIQATKAAKQKILEEHYDFETNSVIGDRPAAGKKTSGTSDTREDTETRTKESNNDSGQTTEKTGKGDSNNKQEKEKNKTDTEPKKNTKPKKGDNSGKESGTQEERVTAELTEKSIPASSTVDNDYKKDAGTRQDRSFTHFDSDSILDSVNLLNAAIARRLIDPVLNGGENKLNQLDTLLADKFPIYNTAMDRMKGVYDDSKILQSLVHKVTNDNINLAKKNKILSLFTDIRAEKNEIISKELQKFKLYTTSMSDTEMETFYDFVYKMSMADYFTYEDSYTDLNQGIADAEKHLPKSLISELQSIVDLNVDGRVDRTTAYSVNMAVPAKGKLQPQARKWVALKSIEALGEERFNTLKKNTGLMDLIRDNALANNYFRQDPKLKNMAVRDNGLVDQYNEPITTRVISLAEIDHYSYEEKSGWKIALEPTEGELGVIYKTEIDGTFQEGTFTDIRLQSGDVDIANEKHKYMPNVVKVGDKYKYIIPLDVKEKMGLIKNPAQGLVRSMAHNMAIKNSDIIRDKLLEKDTFWDISSKGTENLSALIKDKNRDHPWFLGGDLKYHLLPADIKAKYMPVPKTLSDVGGTNSLSNQVKFVRKDISYWLVGSSEKSLASDPKMKWAIRITKDLIAATKIGMIILNPVKILGDNVSNIAYLGVMGVDPLFIQKEYRAISAEFNEYQKLRNMLNNLRVKGYANPEKYEKPIKNLEKKIKSHNSHGLVERGFINSLGSELVMNTDDPSSGFKHDIDTVLKTILTTDGKHNKLGRFIMNFSRWNVSVEGLLEILSKPLRSNASTEIIDAELTRMQNRISEIKTEDDVVAYMHQYLNSPDSEFVKLGTHMTDLTDILARETYYRYLTGKGMTPQKATLEVIDSFPDYKEGMPTKVKQLSDVGILMFPSYWMRIQKAIYRMAKNRPASLATELSIENWAETNASTIWDQNIIEKATSNYGLIHTPWEHLGAGTFYPTNVF